MHGPLASRVPWLVALALVGACAAHRENPADAPPGTPAATTSAPAAAPAGTPEATTADPRTQRWVDLQVGDCLAEPPPDDPSVVTVGIVDCAGTHQAEVYARRPVAVDAAIADVANQACSSELAQYAGAAAAGSLVMTYLIDSRQDRTADNPDPSTVICLLQSATGEPLIGSARS